MSLLHLNLPQSFFSSRDANTLVPPHIVDCGLSFYLAAFTIAGGAGIPTRNSTARTRRFSACLPTPQSHLLTKISNTLEETGAGDKNYWSGKILEKYRETEKPHKKG